MDQRRKIQNDESLFSDDANVGYSKPRSILPKIKTYGEVTENMPYP